MLAAVFQGPGQMEVTEVDTPDIGADDVLGKKTTVCERKSSPLLATSNE